MNNNKTDSSGVWCFLLITAVVLLLRIPYFSYPVIDWDESTFILMGRDVLNGYLPYTHLWDIKPPFLFYVFALLVKISAGHIALLRAAGSLLLALSCCSVYQITRRYSGYYVALAAALMTAVFTSRPFVYIGSEHVAIAFMMPALYLLMSGENRTRNLFCAGILMAMACFTRTNLAFAAFACGLYLSASGYIAAGGRELLRRGIWFSSGFLLFTLLMLLPYVVSGQTELFMHSVFTAALAYASETFSLLHVARDQLQVTWQISIIKSVLLISGLGGAVFLLFSRLVLKNPELLLLIMVLFATELSIFRGGRWFPHYMIQLVPLLVVIAVVTFWYLLTAVAALNPGVVTGLAATVLMVLMSASVLSVLHKPQQMVTRNHEVEQLEAYLQPRMSASGKLVLLDYQVLYWLLDKPVLRASLTHPSNLFKPFLLRYMPGAHPDISSELRAVLDSQPQYVLLRKGMLQRFGQLQPDFLDHYRVVQSLDYTRLYQRRLPLHAAAAAHAGNKEEL